MQPILSPVKGAPLLAALALLTIPAFVLAQGCPATPIASYRVSLEGTDQFRVRAEFRTPTRALAVRFSEVEGRPEAQAESVRDLKGWEGTREVPVRYTGEGAWDAPAPLTRISYLLRADHDAVRWTGGGMDEVGSHFGNTYFFVGNAFFLIDDSWPACPLDVTFDLPADWSVLSPWSGHGRRFQAAAPAFLDKNAFAIGRFTAGHSQAGAMALEWVIDERLAAVSARIVDLMTSLPQRLAAYFGSTPADRYAVVVFQGPYMDGGAFRQSFTLQLSAPVREVDALVWSHGLGHEMLHLWIGNHIRGSVPEETYWFTEGFTDYLAVKLLYQAGVTDEAMVQQRLANIVRRVRLAPRLSPGVGLVEAGTEKNQNWERIYGGGAMVAFLLDAENPSAFQAAMRDLNDHADVPYSQQALLARLDQHTGGAATQAFNAVNDGLTWDALVERLGAVGLELTGFTADEVYVRFANNCSTPACAPAFLQR